MSDFPSSRLSQPSPGEQNLVLVACGAFNPVTFMHLRMFETAKDYLREAYQINVVGGFISPANDAYNKPGLVKGDHRANMVELALSTNPWLSVDRWEMEQDAFQITRVLLAHIQEEVSRHYDDETIMADVKVSLVCGADLLATLARGGIWAYEDSEVIMRDHGIVCMERAGIDLTSLIEGSEFLSRFTDNIKIVPAMITNDVSSTKIRDFVRRGFSTRYLIHDSVREYIDEHGFYVDEPTIVVTGSEEREGEEEES